MAQDKISIKYSDIPYLLSIIDDRVDGFLVKILGEKIDDVRRKVKEWEEKIIKDINKFNDSFDDDEWELFEEFPNHFKDNIFSSLWTVGAALKSKDPDLLRYKTAYKNTDSTEIFKTYKHIILNARSYKENIASSIDLKSIIDIEELKQDFLNEDEMFLIGVIGLGIRSEFLHKTFPAIFSVMTRRSHWGMYFLTSSEEFILYEKGYTKHKGQFRYTNQFNYDYPRFNFYSNYISFRIDDYLEKFGLKIKEEIKLSYVNQFTSHIFELNKDNYNLYNEWREI